MMVVLTIVHPCSIVDAQFLIAKVIRITRLLVCL